MAEILDFGIARATGLDLQSGVYTSHGQFIGTLAFMSPEQLRGAVPDVDRRSDVYAMGVLLFRLFSGRLPFDIAGLPLVEAVQRILQSDTPVLAQPRGRARIAQTHHCSRDGTRAGCAIRVRGRAGSDLRAFLEGRRTRAADVVSAASGDERLLAIGLASGDISVIDVRTGNTLATVRAWRQSGRQPSFPRRRPYRCRVERRAGGHCPPSHGPQAPTIDSLAAFFIVLESTP